MDNSITSLRIPPHSDDAEASFLCAVLERNSLIDDVEGILSAEDFYRPENRVLFARMLAMSMQNHPIDPVTLSNALGKAGEDAIVSAEYIIDLATNGRGAHNAVHYAKIVRDRAIARNLITKGYEIAEIGYSDAEAQDKIDQAQSLIMDSATESSGDIIHINDALRELIDKVERDFNNKGKITGVETGYTDLDKLLYGLHDSDMFVLAGRPGSGKTTLAMNIAERAVTAQKKNVLVFSLEMPREQILARMACSLGRIPSRDLKEGNMENHWGKFTAAVARLKDSTLHVDDRSLLSSEQMLSRARKIQKRIGAKIDLIVVDYIQLMNDKGDGVERMTKISRNVKLAAKELSCPVIAISQLSRKCEERGDKRPVPSDLRDSGAIEQDADVIAMVYRDEVYNEDSYDKGIAEILIRKHRNGEIGTVRLAANLGISRFDNLDAGRLRESEEMHRSNPRPQAKTFSYSGR